MRKEGKVDEVLNTITLSDPDTNEHQPMKGKKRTQSHYAIDKFNIDTEMSLDEAAQKNT